MTARTAEQTYTAADVARLLKLPPRRVAALIDAREIPPAALQVPGGGHKGRRWLASQIAEVFARWDVGSVIHR